MRHYRAILFDLDQTLLNRHQSLLHFCQWQACEYFKFDSATTALFVQRFITLDANGAVWKDQVYTQLKQEFDIPDTVDTLVELYLRQFNLFCSPHASVRKVIQQLYVDGYLLGLISNGRSPFQQHNFYSLGLSQYFSSIIVSEAVGLRKPDSAIFFLACQQLKQRPSQCIFVGDNELADVQGAQSAGLTAIRFDPPTSIEDLSQSRATARINDFSQLLNVIQYLENNNLNQAYRL